MYKTIAIAIATAISLMAFNAPAQQYTPQEPKITYEYIGPIWKDRLGNFRCRTPEAMPGYLVNSRTKVPIRMEAQLINKRLVACVDKLER